MFRYFYSVEIISSRILNSSRIIYVKSQSMLDAHRAVQFLNQCCIITEAENQLDVILMTPITQAHYEAKCKSVQWTLKSRDTDNNKSEIYETVIGDEGDMLLELFDLVNKTKIFKDYIRTLFVINETTQTKQEILIR